ncbi:MAG: hypothetical protein V8S42_06965 [Lachnospiraceae bacterium]
MKAMKALFQKETWIRGMLGVAAFIMVVSLQTFTSLAASEGSGGNCKDPF